MSRLHLRLTCCALALLAAPGLALSAERVVVRSSDHGAFTRVEFAWPSPAKYKLSQTAPGTFRIMFDHTAALDTVGLETSGNLDAVRQISGPGDRLALELTGTRTAHVKTAAHGRVVTLDIYGAPEKPAPAEAAPPPKPLAPPPQPAPPKLAALKPAPPPPVMPQPAPSAQPPSEAALQPAAGADDIVTLSSMTAMGLAAFVAGDDLWIAADRADLTVPPQIVGPHAADIKPQRINAPQASVWRMHLPQDAGGLAKISGSGDGLVWHVAIGHDNHEAHETPPERQADNSVLWPLSSATRVLRVTDPDNGNVYDVAMVGHADDMAGAPWHYVDFETLPSPVGLAVLPHADDVTVQKVAKGIAVGRPSGLTLSSMQDLNRAAMQSTGAAATLRPMAAPAFAEIKMPQPGAAILQAGLQPFFDFQHWVMGGVDALSTNRTILLGGLKPKEPAAQAQDLVTLAKMNIANDRGEEALGFLDYADDIVPAIGDSPEFLALRGAAEAMAGKYELALQDLTSQALTNYRELDYWRAFTLAWLEDWQQASKMMPADLSLLMKYPQPLLEKLIPKFAEIALRQGDYARADRLLDALRSHKDTLQPWTRAAVDYLQGQAARLQGKSDAAIKLWTPLVKGKDNFYRVRAGLALTMLETEKGKKTTAQAIDRLEGLRYAWRGDELEAQINFMLGKLYVQQRQFLKAFTILRDAVQMSPDADITHDINGYMTDTFRNALMTDNNLSPVDAMNIYQQFHELAPAGDAGNKLIQRLADRLASADLLGRSADLLQAQVDYSLQGQEQADIAIRLAAISLLNKDPQRAYAALDKAQGFYMKAAGNPNRDKALRTISLMRARGVGQSGKPEQALAMLTQMGPAPDVSRLRADIAWQAGLWPDAGDALQDLINQENLDNSGQPLNDRQADLILNRAVALNLGGDRVELAKMRQLYAPRMKPTSRGALFDVVTRPHSINVMSEQPTLQGMVGEVDMFKDFLNGYKNVTSKDQTSSSSK